MSNNFDMPQPFQGNSNGFAGMPQRKPRWDANIQWYDIPADGMWHRVRFVMPLFLTASHWLETKNKKRFPVTCLNFDSDTKTFAKAGCPVCEDFDSRNSPDPRIKALASRQQGYIHAIVREKGNALFPMRLPVSVIRSIANQNALNEVEWNGQKYAVDVCDPQYGCDINIIHNNTPDPASRYSVNKSERTPLNQIEQGYLTKLYDWKKLVEISSIDEIRRRLRDLNYYGTTGTSAVGGNTQESMLTDMGKSATMLGQNQAQFGQGYPPAPPAPPAAPPAPPAYAQPVAPQPTHVPQAPQGMTSTPGMYDPSSGSMTSMSPQSPSPSPFNPPQGSSMATPQGAAPMMPTFGGSSVMGELDTEEPVLPPFGSYSAPQSGPSPYGTNGPSAFAPQVMPQAQEVAQQMQTNYPPAPQPMPQPQPPYQAPAFQVPPAYQSSYAAPASQVPQPMTSSPTPATGARVFQMVGKPNGVSAQEYQEIIMGYSAAVARTQPMKTCDRGDLTGFQVPKCYSGYIGDSDCMRCPIRRYCVKQD